MDERSAQGIEHLQAAARELLLAARSFLDVVEEVVEDRDRFAGAASGVADLLRDGLGGVVPGAPDVEPWEAAAWGDAADAADDGTAAEDGAAAGSDPAAEDAPARPAQRRRVRRIAVD